MYDNLRSDIMIQPLTRKLSLGFPTKLHPNYPAQLQIIARKMKYILVTSLDLVLCNQ